MTIFIHSLHIDLAIPKKKTVRPKVVSQIWTENSDDYNCSHFPKDDVNK